MKEKEEVLRIEGMHCDACATTIEKVLQREGGAISASVSFASKKAYVKYDAERIKSR